MGVVFLKGVVAAREKIDVVKALLEDDLGLQDAMSLVLVVDDHNFVCLILVDTQ